MSLLKDKIFLVVDDEALIRELIKDEIELLGGVVEEAPNGEIAYEKIESRKFDFVISDVRMPGGDGISLAKKIKVLQKPTKPAVLFCSGFNDINAQMMRDLDIIELVNKPFNWLDIQNALESYVKQAT